MDRTSLIWRWLRYAPAVLFGQAAGQLAILPVALSVDAVLGWGGDWHTPSSILVWLGVGAIVGCVAGWIAGERGGVVAAVAQLSIIPVAMAAWVSTGTTGAAALAFAPEAGGAWIGLPAAILSGIAAVRNRALGLSRVFAEPSILVGALGLVASLRFHLATIGLAARVGGPLAAVASALSPPLAEVFWLIRGRLPVPLAPCSRGPSVACLSCRQALD